MVARKGEEPPANFPPSPTHDVPVSAVEALRGCDASEGTSVFNAKRVITGHMLEKMRMRA